MTVKELLNKYDFYDYDKTGFESFAVFFPKDDFEKAKRIKYSSVNSIITDILCANGSCPIFR